MSFYDRVNNWINENKAAGKTNTDLVGTIFVDGTTVTQILKQGKGIGLKTQFDCIDLSEKDGVK